MNGRSINRALRRIGFEVTRVGRNIDKRPAFALYKYVKPDGSFDYDRYRQIQTEGNKRKLDRVWAVEENIEYLSRYIERHLGKPGFGICHGTRRGKEQEWFRKYLNCEVIGTEISDTAHQFQHTIRWDFHETKREWIDRVDFIYSNSLDHSYAPQDCLNTWMRCVRPGGFCILEHSLAHEETRTTELDPFGANLVAMPYLIAIWAQGQYGVRDLIEAPARAGTKNLLRTYFIIIQRFRDSVEPL